MCQTPELKVCADGKPRLDMGVTMQPEPPEFETAYQQFNVIKKLPQIYRPNTARAYKIFFDFFCHTQDWWSWANPNHEDHRSYENRETDMRHAQNYLKPPKLPSYRVAWWRRVIRAVAREWYYGQP